MQEKTKKWILSLAVRSAVAAVIFAVLFLIGRFFPQIAQALRPVWTKSMDIRKTGVLLRELLKEALP